MRAVARARMSITRWTWNGRHDEHYGMDYDDDGIDFGIDDGVEIEFAKEYYNWMRLDEDHSCAESSTLLMLLLLQLNENHDHWYRY